MRNTLSTVAEHIEVGGKTELDARPVRPHLTVVNNDVSANTSMHPGAFYMFGAINAATLAVFWYVFRGELEAIFMVGVSTVYLMAYLATPWVMSRLGHFDVPDRRSFSSFLTEPFDTWTGVITGKEAVVQMLIVPVATLFAVTIMGVVIELVRY